QREQVGLVGPHAVVPRRRLQHAAAWWPARSPVARCDDEHGHDRHPACGGRQSERAAQSPPPPPPPPPAPRRPRDPRHPPRGAAATWDVGSTPLLRAARGSDLAAIERLVAKGALLDLPQLTGITPLMAAVGAGAAPTDTRGKFRTELEALATADALLKAGAGIDARDANGRTALHYAAAAGYTDVAKALAEH